MLLRKIRVLFLCNVWWVWGASINYAVCCMGSLVFLRVGWWVGGFWNCRKKISIYEWINARRGPQGVKQLNCTYKSLLISQILFLFELSQNLFLKLCSLQFSQILTSLFIVPSNTSTTWNQRPLYKEVSRDENRQKRSHCIQWERNAIFRSVPTVYSGNAFTVSRPWKFRCPF